MGVLVTKGADLVSLHWALRPHRGEVFFFGYNSGMNPDDVRIIQIAVAQNEGAIYALGEDGNVYQWNSIEGGWTLHVQQYTRHRLTCASCAVR